MNQSPRNMYQCQMGKQTMGTPAHSLEYRTDNKMYRIQTPQAPLVQNERQAAYKMDDYPNGTNAIVAVISYTGFDMEDAMILNKSSAERGFAHASVYKTSIVDLSGGKRSSSRVTKRFGNHLPSDNDNTNRNIISPMGGEVSNNRIVESLDDDGLPPVGLHVAGGDPYYCVVDTEEGTAKPGIHKGTEPAVVDAVKILGTKDNCLQKAKIRLRYNRNPIVGDKFSSRHGQKGVLSIKWPAEDMPFTESGLVPDIIINPHAFPSRMTIGMLCESMAGKAGSLHGVFQDSTPFRFHEGGKEGENTPEDGTRAVDYFGEQLRKAGYAYGGSETLYSGTSGREMKADIFIGVVYYQRLRHMVSDKSQVRATGSVDQLTHQPIKGRKRGGGIRFGEMERDSLIAHGAAYLLQDRLMDCSDAHEAWICTRCQSLLSTRAAFKDSKESAPVSALGGKLNSNRQSIQTCHICNKSDKIRRVTVPYVFRYLANELAAMNMRLSIDCRRANDS